MKDTSAFFHSNMAEKNTLVAIMVMVDTGVPIQLPAIKPTTTGIGVKSIIALNSIEISSLNMNEPLITQTLEKVCCTNNDIYQGE